MCYYIRYVTLSMPKQPAEPPSDAHAVLFQLHDSFGKQLIAMVRAISLPPRHTALALPQFLVQMIQSMTSLLRDTNALLQEIAKVLDVLALLAQEALNNRVFSRHVIELRRRLAQADQVFREALFELQRFVYGLHRVDGVVWPTDLWGGDVSRLAAAATLHQVAFQPSGVGHAFGCRALPKPRVNCQMVSGISLGGSRRSQAGEFSVFTYIEKPCRATLARAQSVASLRKKNAPSNSRWMC
jgi:hypothetical protein